MARKMKDSGIEWIGEIPERWEITKIKHIVSSVTDIDHFMPDSAEFGIPYLMIGDLKDFSSSIDWDSSKKISIEDYKKLSIKSRPQIGDIIFARYASIGTTCYIDTDRDFLVSYACLTIHPSDLIIGKFLSYYLKSSSFAEDVLRRTNSNTQGNVGKDSLVNATIVLPSIIEQTQIVNFLEAKCSDINAMLSKTRSSIEEYKKLKQAVITQAVTKGVRGERETKDSGVEWIGEINHRFSLIKLKYICSILDQYRKPISADKRSQSGSVLYDYYGASGVIDKIDDYTIDDHVMLIGEDGANLRMRNLPLMYEVNGKAWINNHAHILKPTERVDFYYLFYALEGLDINPYITGSAQPKLSQEKLQNIWVLLPDLEEQQEIATYIRSKCAEIDKLIAKKEQLVKELESYKKSLIYEVVTGKMEV